MPRGRPKKKATEPFKLVDDQHNAPKCQNDTLENDTLENAEDTTENNVEENNDAVEIFRTTHICVVAYK